MIQRLRLSLPIVALLGTLLASPALADSTIKVRLISSGAASEVDGTATLQDQSLHGHLAGNGSNIDLTGVVKNASVSVQLVGKILPNCGLPRQFMGGDGANDGSSTSIALTFDCPGKAGVIGGGEEYQFRLELALPPHRQFNAPSSDAG